MIAAYQRVYKTIAKFTTSDSHDVYLEMLSIGWEVGKVIRIIFEFEVLPPSYSN